MKIMSKKMIFEVVLCHHLPPSVLYDCVNYSGDTPNDVGRVCRAEKVAGYVCRRASLLPAAYGTHTALIAAVLTFLFIANTQSHKEMHTDKVPTDKTLPSGSRFAAHRQADRLHIDARLARRDAALNKRRGR